MLKLNTEDLIKAIYVDIIEKYKLNHFIVINENQSVRMTLTMFDSLLHDVVRLTIRKLNERMKEAE